MTVSRTSDFADENTTIGIIATGVFSFELISKHRFLSYSHVLSIQ